MLNLDILPSNFNITGRLIGFFQEKEYIHKHIHHRGTGVDSI